MRKICIKVLNAVFSKGEVNFTLVNGNCKMPCNMELFIFWCLVLSSLCYATVVSTVEMAPSTLTYPGDVYIGVFIDLHKSSSPTFVTKNDTSNELNTAAVQQLWAAIWAIDTLNNQTESDMPKLGLKIFDTYDSSFKTIHHALNFLKGTTADFPELCTKIDDAVPMLGVVGIGQAETLRPALSLFQVYSVPVILATPNAASELPPQPNVMTTAPTMASIVQAIVSLLDELRWKSVYALSSSSAALQDLNQAHSLSVVKAFTFTQKTSNLETFVEILSAKKPGNPVAVVLMLESNEIDRLVQMISGQHFLNEICWIVAIPSFDRSQATRWERVFYKGFLITPHPLHLQEFSASFLNALAGREKGRPIAIDTYLQKVYNCLEREEPNPDAPLCSKLTFNDLQKGYQQDPDVPFVSKAISALAAALRMVEIDKCKLGPQCVKSDLNGPIFKDILAALMKLSFTIQGNEPKEVEGTRLKFTEDGRLIFKHFDVYAFNGSSLPVQVGWYSDNLGLSLNAAWRQQSLIHRVYYSFSELEVMEAFEENQYPDDSSTRKNWIGVLKFSHTTFLGRGWATAVAILGGIGLLMTMYIFVYVLVKICDRTLTGNQFLGILLLLGVMSLYATCMLFILQPSEALCNWRLFLHSFSYCLCYGVLFVKVMQLRGLVSLGLGGQLSHLNQAFTLFFIVGIQVAVNIQWSVLMRPMFEIAEDGEPRCSTTKTDFVCLQVYVLLLLLITCGYALHTRHIKRNHNEGRWVLLASLLNLVIWISWISVYFSTSKEYEEPTICGGLMLAATVVICSVFLPKLHTLNNQNRNLKHKEISLANSTATIFSLTHDLETTSSKSSKAFPTSLFAESLLKNPLYDFGDKTLDFLPEKLDK